MVKSIVKDVLFLRQRSLPAERTDLSAADDLLETLKANAERCVGIAANMIGVRKRLIAVNTGLFNITMLNPEITKRSGPYEAEESCLSLAGARKTTRYEKIEVRYQNREFQWHTQTFHGFPAQIIQHEIDHCNGILI